MSTIHDALINAKIEFSATSWNGFVIYGDKSSINEMNRIISEASKVDELQHRLQFYEACKT